MKKSLIAIAATTAAILVVVAVGAYIWIPDDQLVGWQEKWAQFGVYFGGVLNPLFAMLAFLALLWSIALQDREFRSASRHLAAQAQTSRDELRQMQDDKMRRELLHVVKDIDAQLSRLLSTVITAHGASPRLTIDHMVAEAQRLANGEGKSSAFQQFLKYGRTSGSLVEASVREMIILIAEMRTFLGEYSTLVRGAQAPIIVYYARKAYRLLDMLEYFNGLPEDSRLFFATIGDKNG